MHVPVPGTRPLGRTWTTPRMQSHPWNCSAPALGTAAQRTPQIPGPLQPRALTTARRCSAGSPGAGRSSSAMNAEPTAAQLAGPGSPGEHRPARLHRISSGPSPALQRVSNQPRGPSALCRAARAGLGWGLGWARGHPNRPAPACPDPPASTPTSSSTCRRTVAATGCPRPRARPTTHARRSASPGPRATRQQPP